MLYKGIICNITSGPKIGGRSQMKKEKTISLLQDSVAEIMFDYTGRKPKLMKGGWMT